jgi:DNA (cytosine-5)-methyltransferase 3A
MHFKNVLSCFDGISCGQLALVRTGHTYDNYYASEVDKYAIKIALKNFPQTIQIGDIKTVYSRNLPQIDLLIGGSPCQDLSIAGKRAGLSGERSGLFWHFVRLLRTCKPRYFLLENVASMSKESRDIISEALGVEPILINSALVSAQQRKRLYWTNIPNITQPQDRGILLKDILEDGIGVYSKYNKKISFTKSFSLGLDSHYLTTKQSSMVVSPICIGNINPSGQGMNGYVFHVNGKSSTITTNKGEGQKIFIDLPDGEYTIRKLTPIECERLQTLPDNYTEGVSNTQRYKMIGNGWTVDVIAHIFSFMRED